MSNVGMLRLPFLIYYAVRLTLRRRFPIPKTVCSIWLSVCKHSYVTRRLITFSGHLTPVDEFLVFREKCGWLHVIRPMKSSAVLAFVLLHYCIHFAGLLFFSQMNDIDNTIRISNTNAFVRFTRD